MSENIPTQQSSYPNGSLRVSVVMCTYNGARFLSEQLDSIVRQTYPIYELIIQDDGSTDNTKEVVAQYEKNFSFIHFYQHEGKPGINRNFFTAIARAKGDVIAISDQDDIWELDKIESQLHALGNHWLVGGISRPFSTDGTAVSFDSRIPNIHLLRMLFVGMMPGHTQLFRRDMLQYLPDDSFFMYDLQLQALAAAAEKVAYVPRVVVNQRRHVTAATYCEPVDRRHSLSNIFNSALDSLRIYHTLRPNIRNRFTHWQSFLSVLPWDNETINKARKMARLQSSKSFWGWLRLTAFCVQNRKYLFHVAEKNPLLAVLRAAFFPISCATYYRYLLKEAKFKGTRP